MHQEDPIVCRCSRCGGTIKTGNKAYEIAEVDVLQSREFSTVKKMEIICETCYPELNMDWPARTEFEPEGSRPALDIILDEATPTVG